MNDIEYKIQALVEEKDFDELTPAEREMIYSFMTEERFTERREILLQANRLFEEDRLMLSPDASILSSLKDKLAVGQDKGKVVMKKSGFAWLGYKVSIFKSAAASLLLLIGSYFVFANNKPVVQYLDKEVIVEKKVYDTVYSEKIVEVPVEKIVKVIEYKKAPARKNSDANNISFAVKELEYSAPSKKVELEELKNSYGNTKIDKAELEQFRVSL